MSLINEALKKAQRQRSLDAAPLSSAPSGIAAAAVTTHERSATHRHRSNAPVWFGVGLLLLGAGATVLIMRYGFAPAAPGPVAASTSAPPAAAPAPAPAPVSLPPPAPEPIVTLPPIAPVAPPPAAVTARPAPAAPARPAPRLSPAPEAAPAPDPSPAPVAVVPVAAPAVEDHETQVKTFLASARLAGVRGQDAQARVLMNEKVYRLGNVVEPELGLRLSAVRAGLLVFTDAEGRTYEKPY